MNRPLCTAAVLASALAFAHSAQPKEAPKLSIPKLAPIPKADGAVATEPATTPDTAQTLKTAGQSAQYSVVSVRHFKRESGSAPAGEITLSGSPPSTPPFRSIVRVKCSQRVGAPIEVVVLDPRGDTVMSATGQFHFPAKPASGDETDYSVDWEPTPWPRGGMFKVLVRIAGQPMGTWPIKVQGPAT